MKKLLAGAAGAAMLLSAAMPVLANGSGNVAIVKDNNVSVSAISGANGQMGMVKTKGVAWKGGVVTGGGLSQSITTGPSTATGKQVIVANVDLCGCDGGGFNLAVVKKNDVEVQAVSGANEQMGMVKTKGVAWKGGEVTGGGLSQSVVTDPSTATGKQLIVVNVSGGWGN